MNATNNPIYFPLLSSERLTGGVLSYEEFRDVWARFDGIPKEKQSVLSSKKMTEKIQEFQGTYGLDEKGIESLSVSIRRFFFGSLELPAFRESVSNLVKMRAPGNEAAAWDFIQKEIIAMKPEKEPEPVFDLEESAPSGTVPLPLLQALSRYRLLGNQIITKDRIRLKSQSEPVRPSLFNWIKYYRDELGVGYHDSVQRGNFLFRSENGRRLSDSERERINMILRSVEEDYPLQIDTAAQEIVFPRTETMRSATPQPPISFNPPVERVNPAAPSATVIRGPAFNIPERGPAPQGEHPYGNGELRVEQLAPKKKGLGGLSFSFNHVLPAEKEKMLERKQGDPSIQFTGEPAKKVERLDLPGTPKNPFHIRPVSLVQEDEKDKSERV